MKFLLSAIFIFFLLNTTCWSQNFECQGNEITIPLTGYIAGEIQWQFSDSLENWEDIPDQTSDTLKHTFTETGYFRAKVIYGECDYYSDTTFIQLPETANAGPDIKITNGDTVAFLQADTAQTGLGKWEIVSGEGGVIENDTVANSKFYGIFGKTYILSWNLNAGCDNGTDKMAVIFTVPAPMDGDSNLYGVVTIGKQTWLNKNLMTTKYNDGTPLPSNYYSWYDNNSSNKYIYGGLYYWYAISTEKLCPENWHVPSKDEWMELINYLGGSDVAGGKLKDTVFWNSPNTGATNEVGFRARPGGYRNSSTHYMLKERGYWFSTTLEPVYIDMGEFDYPPVLFEMWYDDAKVYYGTVDYQRRASVRCIYALPPSVGTIPVNGISMNAANSGGFLKSRRGAPVTECGIVYGLSSGPTVTDNIISGDPEKESFELQMTELMNDSVYYVRAFAKNVAGIAYGNEVSFKASGETPELPSSSTGDIISNTSYTANVEGSVISDGGATTEDYGFVYSTSPDPDINDSIVYCEDQLINSGGTGNYSVKISGLNIQTTYYIKTFVTNSVGTYFGEEKNFETLIVFDIDSNLYTTKLDDDDILLVENLKTTRLNDGTHIANITENEAWTNTTDPAYCWYNNDEANKESLGACYNYYTVLTNKLCPAGWILACYDCSGNIKSGLRDDEGIFSLDNSRWTSSYNLSYGASPNSCIYEPGGPSGWYEPFNYGRAVRCRKNK